MVERGCVVFCNVVISIIGRCAYTLSHLLRRIEGNGVAVLLLVFVLVLVLVLVLV